MRGNSFGKLFTVSTFGESHGAALGATIDGVPAGLDFSLSDLQLELDKRRPGRLKISTSRNEADQAEVLSGIFEDKTLGTPITVIVKNTNQKPENYDKLKKEYRPGHADKTTIDKFGTRDHRGGGRSSGRETLSRVIGGYFAGLIIPQIQFSALITEMGPYCSQIESEKKSPLGFIDSALDSEIEKYLLKLKQEGNSVGGRVRLTICNCPAGLGEPVFDKLKADLGKAMLSIGSCMGITFGLGSDFAKLQGDEISKDSSNFGGIEGGISNGQDIYCDIFFKAPSTIGEKAKEGRHDPCILPRVLPVIESMAKIVICDHQLRQNAYQLN